jgi:hypothetical protein
MCLIFLHYLTIADRIDARYKKQEDRNKKQDSGCSMLAILENKIAQPLWCNSKNCLNPKYQTDWFGSFACPNDSFRGDLVI